MVFCLWFPLRGYVVAVLTLRLNICGLTYSDFRHTYFGLHRVASGLSLPTCCFLHGDSTVDNGKYWYTLKLDKTLIWIMKYKIDYYSIQIHRTYSYIILIDNTCREVIFFFFLHERLAQMLEHLVSNKYAKRSIPWYSILKKQIW